MAGNNSTTPSPMRKHDDRVIVVQLLVLLFLCINSVLLSVFCMKDYFYTNMRYILFAMTLVSDCLILIGSNVMLISLHFRIFVHMWFCVIIFMMSSLYTFVTPVTLTAMTLERYVAICMPLCHADLCSTHRALWCVLIIHGISYVPCLLTILSFFALVTFNFYNRLHVCTGELFIVQTWQRHLRSGISQFYFLIMGIIIIFCYVEIMKVAKAASGENKKSTGKGLRTVILHALQLLLCLTQMWCPFIEAAVLKIDFQVFFDVSFFNYLMFALIPRCLSPLIYGLRDDKFMLSLKYYALCGFLRNKPLDLTK